LAQMIASFYLSDFSHDDGLYLAGILQWIARPI
jgi:hypothetical protein